MTKTALTLAAALLTCTTLSSAAEAGGIRVGFGFPLGSFVARPHQSYSAAPSYSAKKHCDKPQRVARHVERDEAPARKVARVKPKVEVAEAPPAPRKIKRTPKVEVAETASAPVKTAKLEDKSVATDAAPSVYVPEATTATAAADVSSTQSTATEVKSTAADVKTAAVTPAEVTAVKEDVKVEAQKVEKVEKTEKAEAKITVPANVKRVCRRFSAAIAGLIDIPCE